MPPPVIKHRGPSYDPIDTSSRLAIVSLVVDHAIRPSSEWAVLEITPFTDDLF